MTTITDHYNVKVESRYYAFLQEDLESAEPQVVRASVERKKEISKENKSKAKREKRTKQLSESKAEEVKEDAKIEEVEIKNDTSEIKEQDKFPIEIPIIKESDNNDENNIRSDKSNRGRGQYFRRNSGGPRRFNNRFNEGNDRGNRKEGTEDENFKVDHFDRKYTNSSRDNAPRRRPFRSRGQFSRGGNRSADNESPVKEMEFPETIGNFEDMQNDSGNIKSDRGGRYQRGRNNRGYGRYPRQFADNNRDRGQDSIGYFNSNQERRPFRGSRGQFRRGRGMRRGRGDFRRSGENEEHSSPRDTNDFDRPDSGNEGKWPKYDEEENDAPEEMTSNPHQFATNTMPTNKNLESELMDIKKSNWCEIEDDHPADSMDDKQFNNDSAANYMTLEEWRATNQQQISMGNLSANNSRKANDGQDVFSGMEVYRKDVKALEEQNVANVPEPSIGLNRQKASIPVSIRFSRGNSGGQSSTDNIGHYGDDYSDRRMTNNGFDKSGSSRTYQDNRGNYRGRGGGGGRASFNNSRGRGGEGGGYRESSRGGNSRGGGGGNRQQSGYFNNRRRGGDERFTSQRDNVNGSYNAYNQHQSMGSSDINLGNEEEFPVLSLG